MRYYTGVGSRETPKEMGATFTGLAGMLANEGWCLRSGGAGGADMAFEAGVRNNKKEIYLPWMAFNQNPSQLFNTSPEAVEIAKSVISHWDTLTEAGKKLHARNVHQVLGRDLKTPSSFLLCWTEGGEVKGGTATAIKLAKLYKIPTLNFGKYKQVDLASACKTFMQFYDFHVVSP